MPGEDSKVVKNRIEEMELERPETAGDAIEKSASPKLTLAFKKNEGE